MIFQFSDWVEVNIEIIYVLWITNNILKYVVKVNVKLEINVINISLIYVVVFIDVRYRV